MSKHLAALFFIFLLGYFLRVMFLPQKALTFGYDQARDAFISQEIVKGDFKILGPPASTPGLYHGVFYYYLLAPAYALGNGDAIVAAYWIALINALTILVVYYFAYSLTKNKLAGILAAFLFAISFEATQYAVWLSNPTIGILTVPLAYLGVWLWLNPSSHKPRKNYLGVILTGLALGLSVQSEIFLFYHIVPIAFWVLYKRKLIKLKAISVFIVSFCIAVSTMILVEIKFGFKGLGGVANLLSSGDAIVSSKGFGDIVVLYFNQLGRVFAFNSYPGNIGYGAMLVFGILLYSLYKWNKKDMSWQPFLATWIFSHITVVSMGGVSTPFLLVGIGPAVSILLGIFFAIWWKKWRLLVLSILLILSFANLSLIFKENPKGQTIFAIQKDMLLSKQLAAIDYTYQSANGKFSINSLTSPLWINIVWTYLYKTYGEPKYGYLPLWHGHDQVGQLDSLTKDDGQTNNYFLIIEPLGGIPIQYYGLTVGEEDAVSRLIEERNFGELVIQKRVKLSTNDKTK